MNRAIDSGSSFIVHRSIIRSLYGLRSHQRASPPHRRESCRQWVAVQQAQLGKAAVSDHPRRQRVPAVRRLQERSQRGDMEGRGGGDAGVERARHWHGSRRSTRAWRRRGGCRVVRSARSGAGLSDHAEGARHRVPDGSAAPLAALLQATCDSAHPQRDREGHPRFFLRSRLRSHRLADPHRERRGGNVDALRDRLLRREGLSLAVRAALSRARGGSVRPRVLLRADISRGEVEDAPAPDGVLDDRARGGVSRVRGAAGSGRGVHRVPHRSRARALPGGTEDAGARSVEAGEREAAVPAHHVSRGDRAARQQRGCPSNSATTSAATKKPSSRIHSIGR